MKILLTGSTGFIGRNLFETWTNRYTLSAPTRQELDLLDSQAVEKYLDAEHFDIVVHTANMNNVRYQMSDAQLLDGNLRMFLNLERCSNLYGKMYYLGSGAEYDMRNYIPQMTESYFGTHIPQDPYGLSKYAMSKLSKGNIFDLRLFGVFGKYEEWQRRFISNMIYRNLTGQVMEMNQNMYFDYLYITDLISILEWFLTHEPARHHYNVCSGQRVELLSLAEMVIEETGMPGEIVILRGGLKPEYTGDNSRLLAEMGKLSLTSMRTAIRELVAYYRENGFH